MNGLLDFIGALLYPVVMIIISPLVLLVKCLIGLLMTVRFIGKQVTAVRIVLKRISLPAFGLHLKNILYFIWVKANPLAFLKYSRETIFRAGGSDRLTKSH